jgi:hypothetical protein
MILSRTGHPFYQNIIPWTVENPALMSVKILNASAWDDINETGRISPWSFHQRSVSLKLLHDLLSQLQHACSDVTIATLQGLLGFEVCFKIAHTLSLVMLETSLTPFRYSSVI